MSMHTPGPWQRSRFVDSQRTRTMSKEWKAAREREEAQIIRGPGEVGTPGCNIVAHVKCENPADFALMIAAPDLLAALEEIADCDHDDEGRIIVRRASIARARDAIRKATAPRRA